MRPKHKNIYQRKSAFEKRENTLGKAYVNRNKRGKFTDSRLNRKLSADDKYQAVLDAKESHSGSAHILTHRGVPIKDLKRNIPVFRDDEPEVVESDVVNDLHFGGGLFSTQDSKNEKLSFRDKMHDLIQRSKEKKAGHQLHQEEVHDNVVKADEDWTNIMDMIKTEFNQQSGSKLKRRLQESSFERNRMAIKEMNSVVNFLQSSGVSRSGGNSLANEKEETTSARSMDRLNKFLDTRTDKTSSGGDDDSAIEEDGPEDKVSSETKKSQPFLEVLHCMSVLVNMNEEKRLQAISSLCQNLQKPIHRFSRLVGGLLISNLLSKATTLRGKSSPELHRFLVNALTISISPEQRPKDLFEPPTSTSCIEVTKEITTKFVVNEEESISALESFMDKKSTASNDILILHCLALLMCLVEREVKASQKRGKTAPEILGPLTERMKLLPTLHYPSALKTKVESVLRQMEEAVKSEKTRPAMKWTEPFYKEIEQIDPIFGDELSVRKRASKTGKRTPLSREEKTRHLKKKVKAERKSAMRELRRDTEFIQTLRRKEQSQKDADRKKKVARIMGDLATQEGDFRKLTKRH